MMSYLRKRDKGFTLLEVMLVVIIIGIIAIIALPRLLVTKEEAAKRSCDSNLQAIRTQLESFRWNEGHAPAIAGGVITPFVTSSDYDEYWPETSTASAACPSDPTAFYSYIASNGGLEPICKCTVAAHSNN